MADWARMTAGLLIESVRTCLSRPIPFLLGALIALPLHLVWYLDLGFWYTPVSVAVPLVNPIFVGGLAYITVSPAPRLTGYWHDVLCRALALVEAEWRLLWSCFLRAITIFGIPFAISLFFRWTFASQAIVLRGSRAEEALDLSDRIVKGVWWQVVGALTMRLVLFSAPFWITLAITRSFDRDVMFVSTLLGTFTAFPLSVCFDTLLFLKLSDRAQVEDSPGQGGLVSSESALPA